MKKIIFASIAFAAASFAAQTTPAKPAANATPNQAAPATAPAVVKSHKKHAVKKASPKKVHGAAATTTPAAGK
jgi:hypothetical protein